MIKAPRISAKYLPILGNLNNIELLANFGVFLVSLKMGGGAREMTIKNWCQEYMGKLSP